VNARADCLGSHHTPYGAFASGGFVQERFDLPAKLSKKAGTDAAGNDLCVSDCFEVDEKTWVVTKVKLQPLYYNQFYGTVRCQKAIKELMNDDLATWHSVRALAVTKMADGEVSIGRHIKMQGRRGGACLEDGTYMRNTTKSTSNLAKLMAAPLAPIADGSPTQSIKRNQSCAGGYGSPNSRHDGVFIPDNGRDAQGNYSFLASAQGKAAPLAPVGDPMDLEQGDGGLKALLERVDKQQAEIKLNGNMVKSLCAQGTRAEEQHAILERKLAEAAVREQAQQSELELLKAQRRADGERQLREYEKEQQEEKAMELREEKAKSGKWPNPYVTPKASVGPSVTPKAPVAEDHSPEDEAQASRDADNAQALVEATNRRALAAELGEWARKAADAARQKWAVEAAELLMRSER
jgi:hypothetical protein